jgi:nitrogen fixation/metabolism regulation signal transduction histidine kinase
MGLIVNTVIGALWYPLHKRRKTVEFSVRDIVSLVLLFFVWAVLTGIAVFIMYLAMRPEGLERLLGSAPLLWAPS